MPSLLYFLVKNLSLFYRLCVQMEHQCRMFILRLFLLPGKRIQVSFCMQEPELEVQVSSAYSRDLCAPLVQLQNTECMLKRCALTSCNLFLRLAPSPFCFCALIFKVSYQFSDTSFKIQSVASHRKRCITGNIKVESLAIFVNTSRFCL